MNVKTFLFLFILSPILWTLAVSSLYYMNTLNIKNANFNIQVISTHNCQYESNILQRKLANSLNLPLTKFSSQCNSIINVDTRYNVSINLKTYNYKILKFEENIASVQNILDNVYISCTYTRDDVTRDITF